jgi:hypothetical protein
MLISFVIEAYEIAKYGILWVNDVLEFISAIVCTEQYVMNNKARLFT